MVYTIIIDSSPDQRSLHVSLFFLKARFLPDPFFPSDWPLSYLRIKSADLTGKKRLWFTLISSSFFLFIFPLYLIFNDRVILSYHGNNVFCLTGLLDHHVIPLFVVIIIKRTLFSGSTFIPFSGGYLIGIFIAIIIVKNHLWSDCDLLRKRILLYMEG